MLIKTKQIDCASKNVFKTWRLPTSAVDTSGDIYWSAVVYIQDTGEIWTHGKLYGGFFSNADNNKVSLTIGGTERILSLDGHVQPYTTLTGSGTIADQAILSTGVANKWTLKTLGKNAFSNEDYLPIDATAEAAKKVINALRFQYNGIDMHSFDGSEARLLNIIQGDNVLITGDGQGNVTIAADPGSDTVNTAGATNKIDTKLFLIGAESQTTSPQTYSNQYVYIGTDNCLYSLGKKVLTDHQTIYNLDLQTLISGETTKVTTFDPNAANNSFTLVQGTNVTLVPDAQNKRVTISSKDTTYDFYNLIFKQGETVIDTYKPTTSPDKTFKAGTNVTFSKNGDDITITTQDTRNTAGTTEKANTKLFLVGAESQSTNPQTYSNAKVYIGTDGKLYSDNKEVSTRDHTHNYAGAKTSGGPALTMDLNPDNLLEATYGTYGGILQDSDNGPIDGSWSNRIKILHNNSSGYYTELAQAISGTVGVWHRRSMAGVVSEWIPIIDNNNFHTYLDESYIQKDSDPSQLKNFVKYSLESGLTINWEEGNTTPTQVLGFKENDSGQAYTFSGDNIRVFANAVNKAGDTMTGNLTTTGISLTSSFGISYNGKPSPLLYCDGTDSFVGMSDATTYIVSGAVDLLHRKNGSDYKIWDASNDGTNSGLDADLLDGVHENELFRNGISEIDGEDNLSNIPANRSGSYVLSHKGWNGAAYVFYTPRSSNSSFGFMLPGGSNTVVKAISTIDSEPSKWKVLGELAYLSSKVASSINSDYPTGFIGKLDSAVWGNQDGTFITGWHGPNDSNIQFRDNNGKLNVIIDGLFYQDIGQYMVLDENNYSSILDGRYLLKSSDVTAGNNSSWLSFSNNEGGIGGIMGIVDWWRIRGGETVGVTGYLELATSNHGNEPIYVRQYSGTFADIKRTLTLLDGNGDTSIPGNLKVSNTTTSGNFSTTGKYISTFASGTFIDSVSNSALTVNTNSFSGIWCAPTKGGRVAMSVNPSNNNNVYIGYASSAQITAGTDAFTKQTYWNADNGFWTSGGYAKENSSDSYVLLGGGGHATLSGLGGSHTHTVLRNNLMIKGTNGISDSASIHLGIGDSDTGFKWISDGVCQIYANNKAIGQWNSGGMNWYYTPQVNGVAVSLSNHTHNNLYVTSLGTKGNYLTWTKNDTTNNITIPYATNCDTVDGWHASSFSKRYYIEIEKKTTVNIEDYVKTAEGVNKIGNFLEAGGWAWSDTAYIKLNDDYTVDRERYSIITCKSGNMNSTWNLQALLFIPIYDNKTMYLTQMNVNGEAGKVSTRVVRFQDYDTTIENISNLYLKKAGDTMTGALNFANNVWNKVGDDVYIGDHNIANYLCIKANSGTTAGINFFSSSDGDIGKLASVNGTLQWKGTNISLDGHTHNYIVSRGNLDAQTGRTQSLGDVYSYNTVSGNTGGPTTYTSVIGFGRGAAGTVEIAGGWTSGMGLWYRALRNITDNWFGWVKVWDSKNFDPDTKFNTSGGTISGAVTINNTLSVSKIKATSTYSSNYVFCADGSIRNFPALFSTNILWASYKVNTGGSGSYSRLSGNYSFITGRTREGTGKLLVTISVPSGYSKTQIMMFATGHHRQDHWGNPIYASIQPDYGVSSSVRIMTADGSSPNDADCIVNFILVKTS